MTTWHVDIETRAKRELKRIPEPYREKIASKILSLNLDPRPHGATSITGKKNTLKIRIGNYRFSYHIDKSARTITVLDCGRRDKIYRPRRNPAWIPNPAERGARRPVAFITDRAKRYRARNSISQAERRCIYCGSARARLDVEHINGREADNRPDNLAWSCRRCNSRKGAAFARAGRGRKTRQYNPTPNGGAHNLAQWIEAVKALHGELSSYSLGEAIATVRATDPDRRSEFAREIWRRRREHGTDRLVPF